MGWQNQIIYLVEGVREISLGVASGLAFIWTGNLAAPYAGALTMQVRAARNEGGRGRGGWGRTRLHASRQAAWSGQALSRLHPHPRLLGGSGKPPSNPWAPNPRLRPPNPPNPTHPPTPTEQLLFSQYQRYSLDRQRRRRREALARAQRRSAEVREAIAALPPRTREVFVMSRERGLRYSEIAEQLEISVKAVEANMSRALRQLRERLAPLLPDHHG
jgi:RNA polymerase sigma factor (sigma-70 family)